MLKVTFIYIVLYIQYRLFQSSFSVMETGTFCISAVFQLNQIQC